MQEKMVDCHTYLIFRHAAVGWSTVQAVCDCGKKTGEMVYCLLIDAKPSAEAAETVLKMLHSETAKGSTIAGD
jgi:hypothetical protein